MPTEGVLLSGDSPLTLAFPGQTCVAGEQDFQAVLWILSQEQAPAHCSLGLVLLAHSVPYRVEAGPGQLRWAPTAHSTLPCLGVHPLMLTQESIKRGSQGVP